MMQEVDVRSEKYFKIQLSIYGEIIHRCIVDIYFVRNFLKHTLQHFDCVNFLYLTVNSGLSFAVILLWLLEANWA